MKRMWTVLVMALATAGIANAADNRPVDLNALNVDPIEILNALAPGHQRGGPGHDQRRNKQQDPDKQKEMPKACTDAAITDAQRTSIETAVFDATREKVQLTADLKLAKMDYARAAMDAASDRAAADAASTKISEGVTKLVGSHLALSNKILYDIVTPDQRRNTFLCIAEMHKNKNHKKGHH